MNLYSPTFIKSLLAEFKIRPKKSLGQHFVINKNVIDKIIQAADLKSGDIVLEIGPGIGTLTLELAKKAKKVIAAEKDKAMCKILQDLLLEENLQNVIILQGDILNFQFPSFHPTDGQPQGDNFQSISDFRTPKIYKIAANIPYYITQLIIRKFLESRNPPEQMVLLVQKEVAQRICAKPRPFSEKGGARMNLLALSVQFYAKPEIISYVSKNNFWPRPKVDSAILKISRISTDLARISQTNFFKIARAGFSSPRKKLISNLSKKINISKDELLKIFEKFGIRPEARAENLSLGQWKKLSTILALRQF